jgi:hypothetical protein
MLVLATVTGMLAGCGTPQGDRAANGAVLGGAAGALIGGLGTGSAQGALIGAGAGAATGAAVGYATTPDRGRCPRDTRLAYDRNGNAICYAYAR